jgi:hypothetical protein
MKPTSTPPRAQPQPGFIGTKDYRPTRQLVLNPPLSRPPPISPAMSPDNKFVRLEGTKVEGTPSTK